VENNPMEEEVIRSYLVEQIRLTWPALLGVQPGREILRDRFRGCLLWGAVGDPLGRPVESKSPEHIRARFGPEGVRDYRKWHGWSDGPTGTITGDTQLTMEIAASLLATGGRFDPTDFAERLVRWLPIGRGPRAVALYSLLC
jgi:ADP-ribosylglycohydrolase